MDQDNISSWEDSLYFQDFDFELISKCILSHRPKERKSIIIANNLFDFFKKGKKLSSEKERLMENLFNLFIEHVFLKENIPLRVLMVSIERALIIKALSLFGGNQKKTAQFLGLNYTTLNEKVKRYNIRIKEIAS